MERRFKLAALLRLRTLREESERDRLLRALHRLQLAQSRASLASNCVIQISRSISQSPLLLGAELHFLSACRRNFDYAAAVAAKETATCLEQHAQQLHIYRRAFQERELVADLRERFLTQLRLFEARREQAQLDDQFALARRQSLPTDPARVARFRRPNSTPQTPSYRQNSPGT